MILSWHYLVCLSNIIRLAISFCESVSSYLYAFSHKFIELLHIASVLLLHSRFIAYDGFSNHSQAKKGELLQNTSISPIKRVLF